MNAYALPPSASANRRFSQRRVQHAHIQRAHPQPPAKQFCKAFRKFCSACGIFCSACRFSPVARAHSSHPFIHPGETPPALLRSNCNSPKLFCNPAPCFHKVMVPFCNIECRFFKNSPTFNISHNTLIINVLQ